MITFTCYGIPQPQGSTRAFVPKGWNRAIITSANAKLKPWRQEVASVAMRAMSSQGKFDRGIPVEVHVSFYFDKPKSVKGEHKTTKPDCDKLIRGLFDSLTGIVFQDDSQVTVCTVRKLFGSPARAEVTVAELKSGDPTRQ